MARAELPRLVVAGLAGDSGKTLVSLGLIRGLMSRGMKVAPFKKGPDFIDAAWLGAAAGAPGRNLDTFLMPVEKILGSLARACREADVAVVEGNRGLFDGMDSAGSHSTAQLARLTRSPVVLVVDVTKTTRTVAALVLGCRTLDPDVDIAGVILNRIGTARQERVIREALAADTDLPVLGAIPRLHDQHLPGRHLGLLTAVEHDRREEVLEKVGQVVARNVDWSALLAAARRAPALDEPFAEPRSPEPRVRIGVLRDRAFSFYYPENLEALEQAGAELVDVSPLEDEDLPDMDGLYAGGGFPEVHASGLSANRVFREKLAGRIAQGLPVWAECGGLMYLSRSLTQDGREHPMVGALPIDVEQTPRPQGHGYVQARVDRANPFLEQGADICGHEFHYSRLRDQVQRVPTILEIQRGVGVGGGRDGIRAGSVVAFYTHLHALGEPDWAPGLVRAAAGDR